MKDLQRIKLGLSDGRSLSIIQGPGAYAGEKTVEVAIVNKDGDLVGEPETHINATGLALMILKQEGKLK